MGTGDALVYVATYAWSASGFGAKKANPSPTLTSDTNGISFSSSGSHIALATDGTPFVRAYTWSSSGFGTIFADPATLPTATGQSVAFGK